MNLTNDKTVTDKEYQAKVKNGEILEEGPSDNHSIHGEAQAADYESYNRVNTEVA